MDNTIQIGKYTCHAFFDVPYNVYILSARGPFIRKCGRTILRCPISAELFDDNSTDWRSLVARQLDQAYEAAYRFAPIMQRKIRRMVRL